MINPKDLLQGHSLEALNRVHALLNQSAGDVDELELFLWLYRLGALMDIMREGLKPKANQVFERLRTTQAAAKTWQPVNFAKLTATPQPTSWTYPVDLIEREATLNRDKQKAQIDKTATHHTGTLDPNKHQLFKVSLLQV